MSHFFFFFFLDKVVEGLLSTGPTPSTFNISDRIDLASFTLFRRGVTMITDSMFFCVKPFITKVGFKYTQNVFEDIPESPN